MESVDIVYQVVLLGPMAVLLVAANFLGYAMKKTGIKGKFIPWALMGFGAALYPFIAELRIDGPVVRSVIVYQVLIGLMVGGFAVALHQGISRFAGIPEDKED
jgi:hypothetical protein